MTQAYMRLPRILRQIKMYSAAPCTSTPRRSRSRVVGGLCTSSALLNMSPLLLLVLEEHLAHVRLVTYKFFRRSALRSLSVVFLFSVSTFLLSQIFDLKGLASRNFSQPLSHTIIFSLISHHALRKASSYHLASPLCRRRTRTRLGQSNHTGPQLWYQSVRSAAMLQPMRRPGGYFQGHRMRVPIQPCLRLSRVEL